MAIIYPDDPKYIPAPQQSETPQQSDGLTLPESATVNVQAEDPSLLDQAVDGFIEGSKAVLNGAAKGINATLDIGPSLLDFGQQVVEKGWDSATFNDVTSPINIPTFDLSGAVVPEIVEDITQFGVSFWGANKATPFLKTYELAGKAAKWGGDFIKGAVADIVGMKAQEENLTATLIEAFPQLEGSILEYLANDGKDSAMEGRLRNALEGMGLGVLLDAGITGVESVMRHLQVKKALDKSKTPEELHDNLKAEGLIKEEEPSPEVKPETKTETTPETEAQAPEEVKVEAPVEEPQPKVEQSEVPQTEAPKSPLTYTKDLIRSVDKDITKYELLSPSERKKLVNNVLEDPECFTELSGNINFNTYAATSPEGRTLLVEMSNALARKKALDRATPMTHADVAKQVAELDEVYGTNAQKLVEAIIDSKKGIEHAMALREQLANILPAKARDAVVKAQAIQNGTAGWQAKLEFIQTFNDIQQLYIADTDLGTASGRLLSFRNKNTGNESGKVKAKDINLFNLFGDMPKLESEEDFKNWIRSQNITEDSIQKAIEAVLKTKGNPGRMLKQGKLLKSASWGQLGTFWFTQNILTSPATHFWNITSNISKIVAKAVEEFAGASINSIRDPKSAKEDFLEAGRYVAQLFHVFSAATRLANASVPDGVDRTLKISSKDWYGTSSKFTDVGTTTADIGSSSYIKDIFRGGEQDKELAWWQEQVANCLGWLGGTARLNSKIMASEDDYFKHLEFQARQYATINRRLDELGVTDPVARQEQYNKIAETWFTNNGLVNLKSKDAADALTLAEQATYSQDVANKTIHEIVKSTNKSPVLKVILPFVKTVWNVEVDLVEHTPLGFASKQFREDIRAGGARARQAKGRMATGTVGITLMYWLCESGMITGELSDNPKEREAQQRAGIKPYSIRVGDTYISYDRLDPFGTLLGMTANFHQIYTKSEDMTEAKRKELGGAIAASLFKATMDKSFLSSLQEFVDVVSDVKNIDTKGSRFLAKQLQGFLPASGAARWLANKTDNIGGGRTERPEGFLEYVKDTPYIRTFNNIAYEAARLPTKYDWFTGKALSGYDYVYTKGKDDWVLDELSYISATTTGKPQRKLGRKVELTNEQYSELCRLHGTVKLRGKTLYEATKELMKSTKYDFDEKRHNHALIGEKRSYKGDLVNKLIDDYRQAAIKELVKKYPQLAVDLKKAKANEKITKRGAGQGRQNTNRSPLSVLQK